MAIWMKVECEGWIGNKGLANVVIGGNRGVKCLKDVLGGEEGVGMDLYGILLGERSVGAEGRKMGGEGNPSEGALTNVMFEVRGK